MRLSAVILLGAVLLTPGASPGQTELAPHECGACHRQQYDEWVISEHHRSQVVCSDCHMELHSSRINGCRECHPKKHEQLFIGWPEVQRFDPPHSSDYVCVICHPAHPGGLDQHHQACAICHNHPTTRNTIAFHAGPAEYAVPTENDGFVLLEAAQNRLLQVPRAKRVFSFLLYYVGGTVLLFPLALGVVVIIKRSDGLP